ncbi:MAG: hypothetical protein MK108_04445 [Mariniblastus sp.]|nr:hypothetical protein [Mariniblastus sp.]
MTHAQQTDPVEAGSTALKDGKFPWYDSDSNTAKPIESAHSRSAASANRGAVTPHAKSAPAVNAQNWGSWIKQLFDGLSSLSYVLLTLLASLIVGLLVWGLIRRRPTEPLMPDDPLGKEAESMMDRIEELPFQVTPQAGDNFEGRAQAAAEAGNYSEAVMLLFSFLLLNLDRKGLIRLRRGTTNRQYLNQIRHHDRLPDFFVQLMEPFEKSFFGGHTIDQTAFEQCWSNLESAKQQLGQGGER